MVRKCDEHRWADIFAEDMARRFIELVEVLEGKK